LARGEHFKTKIAVLFKSFCPAINGKVFVYLITFKHGGKLASVCGYYAEKLALIKYYLGT